MQTSELRKVQSTYCTNWLRLKKPGLQGTPPFVPQSFYSPQYNSICITLLFNIWKWYSAVMVVIIKKLIVKTEPYDPTVGPTRVALMFEYQLLSLGWLRVLRTTYHITYVSMHNAKVWDDYVVGMIIRSAPRAQTQKDGLAYSSWTPHSPGPRSVSWWASMMANWPWKLYGGCSVRKSSDIMIP